MTEGIMKRLFYLIFLGFAVMNCTVAAQQEYAKEVDYTIQINSVKQELNNPVVCIHDRTYLPLRELAELLNLYVVWDEETQMIKISDIGFVADGDNTPIVLSGAEEVAYPSNFRVQINGYIKDLENPLYIIRDRAYLPLRELAELSGMDVDWLAESKTVSITYDRLKEDMEQELIPFEKDGYYGYANADGTIVVEAKYKIALPFSEGLAAVADEHYKFGYIDTQGNLVIQHQFFQAKNFSEGLAAVAVSDWEFDENESEEQINFVLFQELADSYFYIDKTGEKAFEKEFSQAGVFANGYAPVAIVENVDSETYNRGDYTAYINRSGEIVRKYEMDIGAFQDGYAVTEDGIIDTDFEIVFDGKDYDAYSFNNGFITAKKDGKYGVVDLENHIIIDFKYEHLSEYSEGLFAFQSQGMYGYIDINDNVIIQPVYDGADEFINGCAMVENGKDTMFFINKKGEQVSKNMKKTAYSRDENGLTILWEGNEGHYITPAGVYIEEMLIQ